MPINLLELQQQIKEMGEITHERERDLYERLQEVEALLERYANELVYLINLVEMTHQMNNRLRCAKPVDEFLDRSYPPPQPIESHVVIAADGSQINPSRHDAIYFGLVNLGIFWLYEGIEKDPRFAIHSHLLYPGAEGVPHELTLNEQYVALKRDVTERKYLLAAAMEEEHVVIALTDGPLEPFREVQETQELKRMFQDFLQAVVDMATYNGIPAGYVDKPRADLVVRMLGLTTLSKEDLGRPASMQVFRGITDSMLYRSLLKPGERSALFAIQSNPSTQFRDYNPKLAPHFFYLNVGFPRRPMLARVEIPGWVVEDRHKLDLLHASLVNQCRILGNSPYPYALHRAHETARVPYREKEKVEQMILGEFRRLGITLGEQSNKQTVKNAAGH